MGHLEMWRSRQKLKFGKGSRTCVMSGNGKCLVRKYGLNITRQSLRENHDNLGFHKTK